MIQLDLSLNIFIQFMLSNIGTTFMNIAERIYVRIVCAPS